MADIEAGLQIHQCGTCGMPTPEKLSYCRHCRASLSGGKCSDWWSRTFDNGPAAKVIAFFAVLALLYWIGSSSLDRLIGVPRSKAVDTTEYQDTLADTGASTVDEAYNEQVADGRVCADGWSGSNIALVDRVKTTLRDPESFKHDHTTISIRSPKNQYLAVMQYRAKNGFGGYVQGVATATLALAGRRDCQVVQFEVAG